MKGEITQKIRNEYNNLMGHYESSCIDDNNYHEESGKYWTLRDLVAEVDYQLSKYYDSGYGQYEELHPDKSDIQWEKETYGRSQTLNAYNDAKKMVIGVNIGILWVG